MNKTTSQSQHYCIIQQSANQVLTVGQSLQDTINEYNDTYNTNNNEKSFGASLNSSNDIVLIECSELLYTLALDGENVDYEELIDA